ncbi:hypothetical protein LINPERPRIM_LOCUS39416 [Linum perenne]
MHRNKSRPISFIVCLSIWLNLNSICLTYGFRSTPFESHEDKYKEIFHQLCGNTSRDKEDQTQRQTVLDAL